MTAFNLFATALLASLLPGLVEGIVLPRHATAVTRQDVAAASKPYDFIIAGGGIAGLTVADRLTEDKNISVLVIEAGPFDQGEDVVYVPGLFAPYQYFWPGINSEPQTALNNRAFGVAMGRVVGGGSTVNAMVYLRGVKEDYDAWQSLGNPGWSWTDIFPFFKKSENFTAPDPGFAATANISWDDTVRGHAGPLQYSYPNYFFPGSANWWNAVSSTGLKPIKDPNAGSNAGLFWFPTTVDAKTRRRNDARNNHYDRVQPRSNYQILANNLVSKVIFNNGCATGVQYVGTTSGTAQTVMASKEVIIAAGGVHTPQILQLSGIGPKALLNKLNIPVVVDLPGVGTNLQDQALVKPTYNFTNNVVPNSASLDNNATYNSEQYALYQSQKRGAYTIVRTLSTNFADTSLTLATSANNAASVVAAAKARDPGAYLPANTDPTVLAGYKAQRSLILSALASPNHSIGGLFWSTASQATLYHFLPLSRGFVNINSTDPRAAPVVDFRCATDPTDLDQSLALVKKNRQIFAAPDLAKLGPSENAPFGKGVVTDQQLIAAIRQNMEPSNAHQCCTAPMLPRNMGGVVNQNLKVYGVQGLRVVDISFWPMQVAGAPTATMYASSEKIADAIKKEYCIAEYRV